MCETRKTSNGYGLVFHSRTRQVLAMHVGKRTKGSYRDIDGKAIRGRKKSHLLYR